MTFTRCAGASPVVLVVGNDGRDSLVEALSATTAGYEVAAVEDAASARSRIDDAVWCVVAGEGCPAGTGVELAEVFGRRSPPIPVVVADADTEPEAAARVVAAGGRYLPVDPADDASAIRATVDGVVADHERRRSDGLLRSALEQFLTGYDVMAFVKDAEGRYCFASDYGGGPDPDDLLGKTGLELERSRDTEWDDMRHRHELAMTVIETNDPIVERVEKYGEGDGAFWFSHTLVPWRDDGEPKGVVGFVREVSDRKRRERALERQVDRLEEFTNFVSHDLRSPLQLMQGYLELAREGDEDAFEHCFAASERMAELIEDLEELATAEDATIELDRSIEFVAVAREVWNFVATDAATLEVELPAPTTLNGSEAEIRPLLENCFRNAIVHGGEDATVWLGALDDGFYVEDDGQGIPPEHRDEVFSEGFTTSEDGTGTGLAIVMDVVGTHGWNVEITEGRAGGARFEFRNCMMATDPDRGYRLDDAFEIESSVDVGDVKTKGSAVHEEATGIWTVRGGGDDLWGDANDFHFVYAEVEGPVRVQARVREIEPVNPFSKAGVMVRDGLDDDASHGYVGRTVDRGPEVSWRSEWADHSVTQQLRTSSERANWVRIGREGDQVTCSIAEDGENWTVVDQRHVSLSEPVYVGLVVCSVVPRALCTATFEDVSIHELEPTDG